MTQFKQLKVTLKPEELGRRAKYYLRHILSLIR